jgi:hypothetical protein
MPLLKLEAYDRGTLIVNFDSWVLAAPVPTIEKFLYWCHTAHYTAVLTYSNVSGRPPKVVNFTV